MDARFRGHDKALDGRRHPREMPALAEAGAGVHALQAQPLDFDGTLFCIALTCCPGRGMIPIESEE